MQGLSPDSSTNQRIAKASSGGIGAYSVENTKRSTQRYSRLIPSSTWARTALVYRHAFKLNPRNQIEPNLFALNYNDPVQRSNLPSHSRLARSRRSDTTNFRSPISTAMPLIMSPCAPDESNDLIQAQFATCGYSASPPSKHYVKVTDTATDEIAAYAIWISLPAPPQRCHKPVDRDPWLLSSSQLATASNGNNCGLCIGVRERLWSSCLYRGARVASNFRRLGLRVKGVDKQCRVRVRMSVGSCIGLVGA